MLRSWALQVEGAQVSQPSHPKPFPWARQDGAAGRGLTADGDAQLHTTPLGQLHMEGATARDDRLWYKQMWTHVRPTGPTPILVQLGETPKSHCPKPHPVFIHLTDKVTEVW